MRQKAREPDIGAAMASSDSVCGAEPGPAPVARPSAVEQGPNSASAFVQSGSLVEKEVLYRNVLELDPGNADALYLTGVIRFHRRIIAGDPYRKTRLHDEKGNLAGVFQFSCLPSAVQNLQSVTRSTTSYCIQRIIIVCASVVTRIGTVAESASSMVQ